MSFWSGFEKKAENLRVAKAAIFHKGRVLMGVRQDNGRWTEPGGHLNKGEEPLDGIIREVREETGIRLKGSDLDWLGSKNVTKPDGKELEVHAYRADLKSEPDTDVKKDPDKEVFGWNWVPLKNGSLPESIDKNLHVPAKHNVLHFFLGFAGNRPK
jgi:8-oxo-dGTP pyrophosphatase MutT (NUDIX family)